MLASDAPDERRLLALKFVVHLTADLHQPLHAGFADDRGGNSHQLQAWGRGTNLHALWDSGLVKRWPSGRAGLKEAMNAAPTLARQARPSHWAQESCTLVSAAGFYSEKRAVDAAYLKQWGPALVGQLAAAGQRLAEVLDAALVPKRPQHRPQA